MGGKGDAIEITLPKREEYRQVLDMVQRSFNAFDAPDYTESGCRSFMNYAAAENFAARQRRRHVSFLLREGREIAGMIELRENRHISMLFVAPEHIKKGYGRALLEHAVSHMTEKRRLLRHVTVNASPYAYGFYRHMGFADAGERENNDGMIYTPMKLALPAPARRGSGCV